MVLNLSVNCGCVAAYKYVCKDKPLTYVLHSPGHSGMSGMSSHVSSLVTKDAIKTFQTNAKKNRSNTEKIPYLKSPKNVAKEKRLTNCYVSDFMTINNIIKELEVTEAALQRSENGEKDLQTFILNKSPKTLSGLIATTWKMQAAPETVTREHCIWTSVIRNHVAGECAANC